MKKRLISILLVFMMVFSLAACGGSSESSGGNSADTGQPTGTTPDSSDEDWITLNLDFATFLSEKNPCQGNITTLQEKLDEKMPGKITITTYANGTLLGGTDVIDGVISGTCDIGYVQIGMLPARFPISLMMDFPGVSYNSSGVASKVHKEFIETLQPEELEGVVVLLTQDSGPGCFVTTEKATSMADLFGKQIRATAASADTVSAYGATPVTLEMSELYEALRSGLVDGAYTMFGAAANANLHEVAKYALITPLYNSSYMFVMNKDVFNSMPVSQQEAFMEAADEAFYEYTVTYQEAGLTADPPCVSAAKSMELEFLDGDVLEEFKEASSGIIKDYAKTLDEKGLDGTGALNLLIELADKYNNEFTLDQYKDCYYTE